MLLRILCVAALFGPVVGCGGSGGRTVWVTGHLLKGGSNYSPPPEQLVAVTFVAIEVENAEGKVVPDTEPYLADYDPTSGAFKVPGKDGSGIPPGKYRVAIVSKMNREALNSKKASEKPADREKDYLGDKFGPTTSPIVREIKASLDLPIDMDKPTEGAPAGG